jgi:rSAM/selenodomain-associated transferase 2
MTLKYVFSVIVPVLNEADNVNTLIEHIRAGNIHESYEIIFVDGDPEGSTISSIVTNKDSHVKTIISPRGRAVQMNAGAAIATGDILVFLHADTRLPDNAFQKIGSALKSGEYMAGAFDLGIESQKLTLKIIERAASLRSRIRRIPYGDQAIFIRADYFNKIGRYKNIPIMEDVELMQRIKKSGDRICILPDRVITSFRRWEKEGIFYCSIRNIIILSLYYLGVSPEKLERYYKIHKNAKRAKHDQAR